MRIVHISTLHAPLDVRIFHKQCRTLARAGHDVHLLVNNPPAGELDGVKFHGLNPIHSNFRPLRIRRRLVNARDRAIALKADVYHFHDAELILIARKLQRTGARVIYDVHEDSPQEVLDVNQGRPFYAATKHFVFNRLWALSRRVVDYFVCATPTITAKFPADRATTIHNYPLTEEFADTAGRGVAIQPRFIFIGGLSAIRGASEMIEAMHLLSQKYEARLLIIGEFQPPELRDNLERLPGWWRIEFIPWQPREKVVANLAESAAGLVLFHPGPNHMEALPNKIFEYMAAGLPVIASDFPLWRELIGNERCGIMADPLSPASIVAAMDRILQNPDEATAMGLRGAEAVRTRYNWMAEGQQLLKVYESLKR